MTHLEKKFWEFCWFEDKENIKYFMNTHTMQELNIRGITTKLMCRMNPPISILTLLYDEALKLNWDLEPNFSFWAQIAPIHLCERLCMMLDFGFSAYHFKEFANYYHRQ